MATKRKVSPRAPQSRQRPGVQAVISPCLWYDGDAEEAARFYVSIFKNGKITSVTHFPPVGQEVHGRKAGSVMTVDFTLNGVPFTALNGGPLFKFTEAVSMQVLCRTQAEIDYYWEALRAGGDPKAQQCGWLKDRFGLSWQVAPRGMVKLMGDPRSKGGQRAFAAMMEMSRIDIAALKAAAKG
jgi:Uncharacterized protein conserved in bacteria